MSYGTVSVPVPVPVCLCECMSACASERAFFPPLDAFFLSSISNYVFSIIRVDLSLSPKLFRNRSVCLFEGEMMGIQSCVVTFFIHTWPNRQKNSIRSVTLAMKFRPPSSRKTTPAKVHQNCWSIVITCCQFNLSMQSNVSERLTLRWSSSLVLLLMMIFFFTWNLFEAVFFSFCCWLTNVSHARSQQQQSPNIHFIIQIVRFVVVVFRGPSTLDKETRIRVNKY